MGLFSSKTEDRAPGAGEPLSNGTQGAVAAASEQVKSKRGGFRPGSGRKPLNAGPGVAGVKPGTAEPPQAEVSEADIEFVRTVAEAGLKILDRVETNVITGLINSIGDDFVKERTESYLKMR